MRIPQEVKKEADQALDKAESNVFIPMVMLVFAGFVAGFVVLAVGSARGSVPLMKVGLKTSAGSLLVGGVATLAFTIIAGKWAHSTVIDTYIIQHEKAKKESLVTDDDL